MSDPVSGRDPPSKRSPLAFDATDPALIVEPPPPEPARAPRPGASGDRQDGSAARGDRTTEAPTGAAALSSGFGWTAVLIGSLTALAGLAAALAFNRLVSEVLSRNDWIGLAGWSLLGIAALAAAVIVLREVAGLLRLGRLAHLRREAELAIATGDTDGERSVVRTLRRAVARRPEMAWAAARFAEHERDVRDVGDLVRLADRELIAPLDAEARQLILAAAKRVSLVTAMSPIAAIAVGYVLVENMRLLRGLATIYGGRPGFLGGMRLARMVFVHILATGGVALTDDLIGQFLGQGLAQRLSRRLGEGLFNGALTARIGVAALDICRPLPFVAAKPVRIRDILAELTRRTPDLPPASP